MLIKDKYKVIKVKMRYYPYVSLLLQDVRTGEEKWWVYTYVYDDELCKQLGVKDLTGCTLAEIPEHGEWTNEKDKDYFHL